MNANSLVAFGKTIALVAASFVALFGGVHLWWVPWRWRKLADRIDGTRR